MPHLSPFNWILTPILFWLLLISFTSFLWWNQFPQFPKLSSSFTYPSNHLWFW